MGRPSIKDVRRQEIIEAFYSVAKREGLEKASMAKIAAEISINPSLIIHYFNTREDLIFGLIEFILDRYRLLYNPKVKLIDPEKKIRKIIDNLFSRKWNKLFDDGVFYSCYALIFRDKKIKSHFKALHDSLHSFLRNALVEAQEHGVISIINPDKAAEQIFVIIDGAYYYLGLVDDQKEYEEKLNLYKQMAFRLLNLSVESR